MMPGELRTESFLKRLVEVRKQGWSEGTGSQDTGLTRRKAEKAESSDGHGAGS